LKGVVTEWIWANPHCFLKFDAKDDTGTMRNWAVETQNPVSMTARGWSRNGFKVGDEVTVKLEPVKNGAPVGRILSVLLPNGLGLNVDEKALQKYRVAGFERRGAPGLSIPCDPLA